jgi:hypothetical protein
MRRLAVGDAEACDAIVTCLPYLFGNEEGRRDCSANGFVLARDFPGLWSAGDTPVLMVRWLTEDLGRTTP